MKTLFISFFLLTSVLTNDTVQDIEKMTATFDSYEGTVFYFIDKDGYTNAFEHISEKAQAMYDLTSADFIGKSFQITYTSDTEMDESDEEISVNSIVSLKLLE